MNPTEGSNRIQTLDYLRGFALLGILLINSVFLLSARTPIPGTMDEQYWKFLYLFVEGRFFTIFSFLFGIGFYLFISRAIAKGNNGYILFLRRLLAMFLFGLIHSMYHPGEALSIYAVFGLLVLPLYKLKKELNLVISLGLLFVFSLVGMKVILPLPMILLGLAAGQYRVFEQISAKKKKIIWFTMIAFILSVLALVYQNHQLPTQAFQESNSLYWFYYIGLMVGPIVSSLYVGAFILLVQSPFIQRLFLPLKAYGRMALTNYLMQTVFIMIVGYGLNLSGQIHYLQTLFICVVIYLIQLLYSILWLRFFHFGPLEWVWRMFTYLEVPPLLKRK